MSQKIKVLHLIPSIASGGGAEAVVLNLFRSIDREKFQLTLLYWSDPDDLAAFFREAGADVRRVSLSKVISVGSVFSLARILRELKADILHTHFIDADWLGFWSSRLAGVPMVMEVHSFPFPACRRHGWRYRLMSVGMRSIICVSGKVRDHMKVMTGIGQKKFKVIYNGLDIARFSSHLTDDSRQELRRLLGFSAEDLIVGNVSRLIADKGHEVLLKAVPAIAAKYPRAKFLIVGEGALRGSLETLAKDLGVADKVVFAGKRQDIAALLDIMDVFVFPTYREAFGMCILEAMAAGKPIIATNDAAIPEIMRDGEDGRLIVPGDPLKLAEAVIGLVKDASMRAKFSRNALARVKDFSVEAMARQYEKLYQEIHCS